MEMFLTIMMAAVVVLALSCLVFGQVAREERQRAEAEAKPTLRLTVEQSRFFAEEGAAPAPPKQIPIEALLSRIESHVRMEQAVAESFLEVPTAEALHSRTVSPLLH